MKAIPYTMTILSFFIPDIGYGKNPEFDTAYAYNYLQYNIEANLRIGNKAEALKFAHKLRLYAYEFKTGHENDIILADFYIIEQTSSAQEADVYLKEAEQIIEGEGEKIYKEYRWRIKYGRGSYYYKNGDYENALLRFEQCISLDDNHRDAYLAYFYIAYIYDKKGNHSRAKEYYEISINSAKQTAPASLGYLLLLFSQNQRKTGYYLEAEKLLNYAFRVIENAPATTPHLLPFKASLYLEYSAFHREACRLEQSEYFLQKLDELPASVRNELIFDIAVERARTLMEQGKGFQARDSILAGLEILEQIYPQKKHLKKGRLWTLVGQALALEGFSTEALSAWQKALSYFYTDFIPDNNLYRCPVVSAGTGAMFALETLFEIARTAGNFDPRTQTADLEKSLALYDSCAVLIRRIRMDFSRNDAKISVARQTRPVFEEAIELCHRLFELSGNLQYVMKALDFSEQSKGVTLKESLNDILSKNMANIDTGLLRQEQTIHLNIANFSGKMQDSANLPDVYGKYKKWILTEEKRLDTLIEKLRRDNPAYVELKYSTRPPGLKELVPALRKLDAAIFSYFWASEFVYLLRIEPGNIYFHRFAKTPALKRNMENLAFYCTDGIQKTEQLQEFRTCARQLSDGLLGNLPSTKRLVIIPDGPVCFIPFGALVIGDEKEEPSFLSQRFVISYANSLSTWVISLDAQPHSNDSYYAFAPRSFPGAGLPDLSNSGEHISCLNSLFAGKAITGAEAIKQKVYEFSESGDACNLLVFYTHARSETPPQIYLYDAPLYLQELYRLRLNANQAILATCDGQTGIWSPGEGVLSLSRGFLYTGVPAVTGAMWAVNEGSTHEILSRYYQLLKKGADKDEALSQAQTTWMESKSGVEKSPYYWAGLILIGNPFSTQSPDLAYVYILCALWLAISAVLLVLHRKFTM